MPSFSLKRYLDKTVSLLNYGYIDYNPRINLTDLQWLHIDGPMTMLYFFFMHFGLLDIYSMCFIIQLDICTFSFNI